MNIHETLAYGKRGGFVFLRYVSIIFFFISQVATYLVILNALTQAANALGALQSRDIIGVITALVSFKIAGPLGTVVQIMRNMGSLVIPLYFVATISFVLNLNRGGIGKITRRTALIATLLFFAELAIYAIILGGVALLEAIAYAQELVTERVTLVMFNNLPSFNIFLDQLLCLLMCIFFCFHPKWANTKAKRILFRTLGVLPISYIIAAFILNGLMRSGVIAPNLMLMGLFPAKHLPHFLFIGCILFCHRFQDVRGAKMGIGFDFVPSSRKIYRSTPPAFETAAAAKRRSLQTAVFLSVCLFLLSAADFVLGFLPFAAKWGLGKSYYAVFCIPFFFFFDGRKPVAKKDYTVFSLVYLAVIVVVVVIYLFF